VDNKKYYPYSEIEIFRMLLENPLEGIAYVDENRIIRYMNPSMRKYNNFTLEEIVGTKIDDLPWFEEGIGQVLQTKRSQPLGLAYVKDRYFLASRIAIYHDKKFAGVFCRYFAIDARDITQRWGTSYVNYIAGLQIKAIMASITETLNELQFYDNAIHSRTSIEKIIGTSPLMQELKKKVLQISDSPSTVLITGESGTGKELFAQAIHYHGKRSSSPFIRVNCAAIPENLLESELFGYVEGAFTGARKGGKVGKFEYANKGTIFLDEIGDIPLNVQVKLLRVLQEKEIERLGDVHPLSLNVRVVCATNRDLQYLLKEGMFREDLYYRINVVRFELPPLRERKEDIPALVNHLVNKLNKELNLSIYKLSPQAIDLLIAYDWPGNIRELENVLESAMNFCTSNILDTSSLPHFLHMHKKNMGITTPIDHIDLQAKVDDAEREQLLLALQQSKGKRKEASQKLNISKSTLYRLMVKHGLL
jgi:transcriptional regulator with PAS, ATPase and Fis domain